MNASPDFPRPPRHRPIGATPRWLPAAATAVLALAFLVPTPAQSAAAPDDYLFVRPNGPAEWAASGDFNGDGLLDAVIVDRATGAYRIGYQSPDGTHTWIAPRASGVADVSGVSIGHLLDGATHALAVTAEAANRVNIIAASSTTQAGVPVPVHLPSVGPNQVIAIDIGGPGNTALHDLVVPSAWNGVAPYRITTLRNSDGAAYATLNDAAATRRLERGNRVLIKEGSNPVLAALARGETDTLELVRYPNGPAEKLLEVPDLPPGSEYAAGRFAGNGLGHFLTYVPGENNLRAYPVLEPILDTFEVGPATVFPLADPIDSVITLPGDSATKILVVFNNGTRAAAYEFDGTSAPVEIGEFFPPEGGQLFGATPLENNGVRLNTGSNSRTTRSLQYSFDSGTGTFSLVHTDALPSVTDLTGQANVFQFQGEPFVAPAPRLLNSGNAGDWSSVFSLAGGPPQVDVLSERFVDSTHGLDNPSPANLGPGHPLAQFGLVNQYAEVVSLFSLAPGLGNEIVDVKAQPAGGLYARSVNVSFVLGAPGFQVLYRLNPAGAWQTYAGVPVPIFTNSVLQFRARAFFGTAQTAIRSEAYQFKSTPGELDSDSDGVPDYVEIANDLDPRSGSDHDGDGHSDLDELLGKTSPGDKSSHPATPGHEEHATVDLVVTPRPLDGVNDVETSSKPGTIIRLYGLSGSLLGSATVSGPLLMPVSGRITGVPVDPRNPLLLVATEPHFDVVTAEADTRIGRELVGVIPSPVVAPIVVNYEFGGANGVVNAEALNWVAAARAAYGSATTEVRFHSMPTTGTTIAALLEHRLQSILAEASSSRTNLTLFPSRPADAGRMTLDNEARSLLEHTSPTRPAYDLKQLFNSLTALVDSPNPQVKSLDSVVHEIYRISSALNNQNPGQYRLPLDVLRQFLREGTIHSNHVAVGNFPAQLLADAAAGAQFVLDNLGSRPVTNLTLRVREDTHIGPCTTLETTDAAMTPVNLFAPGGGAFDFPDTFELLPGSLVQVVGRPDVSSTTCAGLNVEVLGISLGAIPSSSDGDSNGNLLIDSWEKVFLGMLGSDPFGDDDGDGRTNLEEMFEGTDPRDRLGVPPGPPAGLTLPTLNIESTVEDGVELAWYWPEAYMDKVQFQILSTTDLGLAPTAQPITPVHQGGGVFSVILPNPGQGTQFFKVVLQLKL